MTSTGLGLRTKFLLASFIPTIFVMSIIIVLFVRQFNDLVIQKQVDDLHTVSTMLESVVSSPEIKNYSHLIQSAILLLSHLRKEVTRITVYAPEGSELVAIAALEDADLGKRAEPERLAVFGEETERVSHLSEKGHHKLELDVPLFSGGKAVGLVSIESTLVVQESMMAYLRRLVFFVVPAGGGLLWGLVYLSFKRIYGSRLSNLSAASKEISEGKWPSEIPVRGKDEMGELEAAFNHMSKSRKNAEEALANQAIRDSLTNLYNRRYFDARIEEEITRAERLDQPFSVFVCDIDTFKGINDSLGHQAGDEVLKQVADRLRQATRGSDLIFRWGGDEFVIILPESVHEGAMTIATRVREGIQTIAREAETFVDLSIGVSFYPEHGTDAETLVRVADRALYIAKKGGDKIHVGEEEFHLSDNAVTAVFQSIIDIRNEMPLAYEALGRDPNGKHGVQDLFKKYQAIGQLREFKALCFKTQLEKATEGGLKRVFINVDFDLLGYMKLRPLPHGLEVILEISELEALHDIDSHLKEAGRWRSLGYQFAIDDFGAGFISLSFISQLVPEYIKIDRSAILRADSSKKFRRFLGEMVMTLQNYTKKGIIAEGIETEQELAVVESMGIHLIQGYLFGQPHPVAKRDPEPIAKTGS